MAKKILFVHTNFPGQFPHIVTALQAAGHRIRAIGSSTASDFKGIKPQRWGIKRGTTPGIFEAATRAEADLLRADGAAKQARILKAHGFIPDLIIGHPGWGETLHLSTIFPNVPQIMFGEFFYQVVGGDVNFDPEFETRDDEQDMRVHAKNAVMTQAYAQADVIVSPTKFQASTFP
jgi:Glycosyl transferase family 4 group